MVFIVRLIVIVLIIFLIFRAVRYLLDPKRKLELAHDHQKFYFLDDSADARKNFLVTHKGVLFEGEKYLGTTNKAFEIVTILIWAKDPDKLAGLTINDFQFIEKEVKRCYPKATIEWKSPIKEFLEESKKPFR